MRIAVGTDALDNSPRNARIWGEQVLMRLPATLPDATFVYHDDDKETDWPAQEMIPQFANARADLAYVLDKNPYFDNRPTVMTCFSVDEAVFPPKSWWPFHRSPLATMEQSFTSAEAIVVPHARLREAIVDLFPAISQKVKVVGFALSEETANLPPADSVTRRITKEVYGREQSFFLAPVTGQEADNLERLVQAYDRFRQLCPEVVLLLVPGGRNQQPRGARQAINVSPFKSDIVFLPDLSDTEYWKVYSSARAILYPSLSTEFPLEILRAWHAQVPVLAVDNDVLQGAGALVQGEVVKSIAEGILALVTTPFLASGLVENGKKRLGSFTWNGVAERIAGVLSDSGKASST